MPSSQFDVDGDEEVVIYEEDDISIIPEPKIKQEQKPEFSGSPIAQKSVNSLSLEDAQRCAQCRAERHNRATSGRP